MSSIPGPVISFRINSPELSGAIRPALDQIKREAKNASQQIAQDWEVMSAKLRGYVARGLLTDKEVTNERQKIVGLLNTQIALQNAAVEPTRKQLANFKAMTLELERQNDALKRGAAVGITKGTSSALNQVSTQTVLGLTRALDSFVDRVFGGVAGALTRTVRDVGYYSAQAGGQGGIKGGISGALSAIGNVNPNLLGAGIGVASIAATGAAVAAVTRQMMEYAQSVQNVAAATGLSYSETQKFREIAKLTGLDAETLTTSFGRLQAELGKFIISGKDSEGALRIL